MLVSPLPWKIEAQRMASDVDGPTGGSSVHVEAYESTGQRFQRKKFLPTSKKTYFCEHILCKFF